jgi:hypothetical protein
MKEAVPVHQKPNSRFAQRAKLVTYLVELGGDKKVAVGSVNNT